MFFHLVFSAGAWLSHRVWIEINCHLRTDAPRAVRGHLGLDAKIWSPGGSPGASFLCWEGWHVSRDTPVCGGSTCPCGPLPMGAGERDITEQCDAITCTLCTQFPYRSCFFYFQGNRKDDSDQPLSWPLSSCKELKVCGDTQAVRWVRKKSTTDVTADSSESRRCSDTKVTGASLPSKRHPWSPESVSSLCCPSVSSGWHSLWTGGAALRVA